MKRKLTAILLVLALVLGSSVSVFAAPYFYNQTPLSYRMQALQQLIEELQVYYKDEVSLDELMYGAYQGLFEGLGDQWSAFYPPNVDSGLQRYVTTEEHFEGIGVSIFANEEGHIEIQAIILDSPAYYAGLRSGDRIVQIDNINVYRYALEDVADMLRGPAGSSVSIVVERDGALVSFSLVRAPIGGSDSVSWEMLDDRIGYIRIKSFENTTAFEFTKARMDLLDKGAKALMLDLRGNGGGLLNTALDIANQMTPNEDKILCQQIRRNRLVDTIYSDQTGNDLRWVPIVTLIDGNTASASEALAAALRDNYVSLLLGTRSYGKGVAQYVQAMGDGSYYRYSSFYFVGASGHQIDGVGLNPDIFVDNRTIYATEGMTEEKVAALRDSLLPMEELVEYGMGEIGLNIYAAQQRLQILGYDVELTARLDAKTRDVLYLVQEDAGFQTPDGRLDFATMARIRDLLDAYFSHKTEDLQLQAAIDYLNAQTRWQK